MSGDRGGSGGVQRYSGDDVIGDGAGCDFYGDDDDDDDNTGNDGRVIRRYDSGSDENGDGVS